MEGALSPARRGIGSGGGGLRGPRLVLALAALAVGCGGAPPNLLLLITVDTLRADRLAAYGGERGSTPHLDVLSERSLVFRAAYAPASFTLPSVSALLTGRYPESLGIWSNESAVPGSAATLASELRARGWRTAAVVSNFVLREGSGLAAGFDVYDDELPQREAVRQWPERTAADTTDAALTVLDVCTAGADARCFLWVHFQDPHGPYTPPPGWRERYLEAESRAPDGMRNLPVRPDQAGLGGIPRYQFVDGRRAVGFYRAGYEAEVGYVDQEIGRLLDGLHERGLARRAAIVFCADHGESLGEGDYWFSHGEHLTDPLVRVPLLVSAPGLRAGVRDDVASLVDLFPTLLALAAGVPPDPQRPGRDLLAPGASGAASTPYLATLAGSEVPRFGLVEGEFKFVVTERDGVWDGRLVRRGNEEIDLTAAAPQVASAMRARLLAARERIGGAPETRQTLTPEDVDKLRGLGYLE